MLDGKALILGHTHAHRGILNTHTMARNVSKHKQGLHTGQLINEVLLSKRITRAALARATQRSASNISELVRSSSTQAYILWEMSQALNHNLFADLAARLDAATEGRMQDGKVTIESLQKELQQLREERDILMKALGARV
jgi:hypothetical protein